jgi:hypothetical protein
MIFPRSPRNKKVIEAVNDFFINENIDNFPIDPFIIIKKNKWALIKYSELAKLHSVSVRDVIKAYQSEDGYIICDNDNYTIAYNDTKGPFGRIRFTLMHEIGHIYMNHLIDFKETILKRSELTKSKYAILEIEAHSFARNTLAPAVIINGFNLKNNTIHIGELMTWFRITKKAAETRLSFLRRDLELSILFGLLLTDNFKKYIHDTLYTKRCYRCKHNFSIPDSIFCPICRNKKLSKKKGSSEMIYDSHPLDENSKAINCPICKNEEVDSGDYCKVCSTYLVNKCTGVIRNEYDGNIEGDCDTLADGNARYCTKCGSETTFYKYNLLRAWNTENKLELVNGEAAAANDIDKPIDISDEDLPFK